MLTVKQEDVLNIIRDALTLGTTPVATFSGGKDSLVLLHLIRRVYNQKIPIPVLHIDTTSGCSLAHNFVEKIRKLWQFRLVTKGRRPFTPAEIPQAARDLGADLLFLATKGEEFDNTESPCTLHREEGIIYSYPLIHLSDQDVWDYIRLYNLPYCFLYDKGLKSIRNLSEQQVQQILQLEEQPDADVAERLRYLGYM
jgi:phosphoadenosine phosphosulfate reductase